MAIDNENLEMVELLIEYRVETKDALLHAISEEYVEAVEVLLDHEQTIHKPGEPHVRFYFWFQVELNLKISIWKIDKFNMTNLKWSFYCFTDFFCFKRAVIVGFFWPAQYPFGPLENLMCPNCV